jgi:hypothetical protein
VPRKLSPLKSWKVTLPTWRSRFDGLVRPTEMLSRIASGVPPRTSTLSMIVGYVLRLSRPMRPAGTVKPMSVRATCPSGVSVTALVLPTRRKREPFVVVKSYVNWSNARWSL